MCCEDKDSKPGCIVAGGLDALDTSLRELNDGGSGKCTDPMDLDWASWLRLPS